MTMPMRPEVDPTKLLEELRRLSAQRPDAARVGINPDYDPGLLRPSLPLEMGAGMVSYIRDNPLRAALDFTPGVGDALAVKDAGSDLMSAGRAAREGRVGATFGNLGMAGLNLASAIPVVGAVGDVIKGGVKGAKAAPAAARSVRSPTNLATPANAGASAPRSIADVEAPWAAEGVVLDAFESTARPDVITLSRLVVPEAQRGSGVGTAVMRDLLQYADESGRTVALTPSTDFGATSVDRLRQFYRGLGFVDNKGKTKDFAISEAMYRPPQTGARPTRPARSLQQVLEARTAPAASVPERWKPTPRGILNRDGLRDMQGTVPSDPRLVAAEGPRARSSMLVDAIATSPQVQAGLRADAERGFRMGAERWYDMSPLRRFIEERGGPGTISFDDFTRVGSGASMQNSVPSEISASTILNFARKRGLPLKEAKRIFLRETGTGKLPMLTGMHRKVGEKAIDTGALLPENLLGANWKVPMYADKRLGGGGILDVDAPGALPALDTHEKRRLLQLARQDPQVAKLMKELGVFDLDHVPIKNAADYRALGGMYVDAAREMGLPTSGTFQAGRWVGGWDQTGLKSPPFGDYTQILEDLITYSAQRRGMPSDPQSLRRYFDRVLTGDDFIVPFTGKGAIPVGPQGR